MSPAVIARRGSERWELVERGTGLTFLAEHAAEHSGDDDEEQDGAADDDDHHHLALLFRLVVEDIFLKARGIDAQTEEEDDG